MLCLHRKHCHRRHHRHHCSSSDNSNPFVPLIPGPQGPVGATGPIGVAGPTGATGATGATGSLATVLSSSFSTDLQTLPTTAATPFPVSFTTEQFPPIGIVHPVNGDDSIFQVPVAGLYHVTWTFTISTPPPPFPPTSTQEIFVRLIDPNPIPITAYDPDPFQAFTVPPGVAVTVSGQTTLNLAALANLQLQLTVLTIVTDPPPVAANLLTPTFTITLLAPAS